MSFRLEDGRLLLSRSERERQPLLTRLRRVEGQVRGVIEMIENDRYCGDELQQIGAAAAALREVAILLATEHASAAVEAGIAEGGASAVTEDLATILRAVLRSS